MQKISQPSQEELNNYYIVEAHTKEECCEHFGVSSTTFSRWLQAYHLRKEQTDIERTNLRIYGEKYAMSTEATLTKRRQTCVERYGCANPMQTAAVRNRVAATCLEKYGSTSVLKNPEICAKIERTCTERYGASNPFASAEIKQRIKETCQKKYGVSSAAQAHICHPEIWNDANALRKHLLSCPEPPTVLDLMQFFAVTDVAVGQKARAYGLVDLINFRPTRSRYEDELVNLFHSWGVVNLACNTRDVLSGQEIDLYLPDYHLGVEFNGDYWHSDIFHTDHGGRSDYHQKKSLIAEQAGIFLFHIFEHEWLDPVVRVNIVNRLRSLLCLNIHKVPARQCKVAELDKRTKQQFLTENHIQGNDHSTICLGLFYDDTLVSCMTFVRPKSKKYTWELSRFCTKHGYNVQGGASKLFAHFIAHLK